MTIYEAGTSIIPILQRTRGREIKDLSKGSWLTCCREEIRSQADRLQHLFPPHPNLRATEWGILPPTHACLALDILSNTFFFFLRELLLVWSLDSLGKQADLDDGWEVGEPSMDFLIIICLFLIKMGFAAHEAQNCRVS